MSLPPDVLASIAENDRVVKRSLLAALLVVMCAVWAFVYWRIDVARTDWFATIAKVDSIGVDVNATITSTRCKSGGSTYVEYRWHFDGKEYSGTGSACQSKCEKLSVGEEVKLRFIPASPTLFACMPNDIRRQTEPPSFLDAVFFLVFATLAIFVKLYETYQDPTPQDRPYY